MNVKIVVLFFLSLKSIAFCAQHPKKIEIKELVEPKKGGMVDCFDTIKKMIQLSPHQMPDWDKCPIGSKEMELRTECANAADYIVTLFTGKEKVWDDYISILYERTFKQRVTKSQTEYLGTFQDFIKKKKDRPHYDNEVANRLLTATGKPEHLLFYVVLYAGTHILVIEKMSDGKKVWWRVYQSWYKYFTLAEWLGIDKWHHKEFKSLLLSFYKYGEGKRLDKEQIIEFIDSTIKTMQKEIDLETVVPIPFEIAQTVSFYIRVFDVDPIMCTSLEEKLKKEEISPVVSKKPQEPEKH
jgi:hypothetical protein